MRTGSTDKVNRLKTIAFLLCVCALGLNGTAAVPDILWARLFGGAGFDYSADIAVDRTGNLFVTGTFTPPIDFDGWIVDTNEPRKAVVAKIDSTGHVQWVSTGVGGASVAVDPAGHIFALRERQPNKTNTRWALELAKIASDGRIEWEQSFEGSPVAFAEDLAIADNGDALVLGGFTSELTIGDRKLTSSAGGFGGVGGAIFLARFDPNGRLRWVQTAHGGFNHHLGKRIAVAPDGGFVICGSFRDSIDLGTQRFEAGNNTMVYLAKVDAAGNFGWAAAAEQYTSRVAVDSAGDIYMTGDGRQSQVYLAKYSSAGQLVWTREAVSTHRASSKAIATDPAGDVYITGIFERQISFGEIMLTTDVRQTEAFLTKYDSMGNSVWAMKLTQNERQLSSSEPSVGRGIVVTPSGDVVVIGDNLGDVRIGSNPLPGYGWIDVFLVTATPSIQPPEPRITVQPLDRTVPAESTVEFAAFATGEADIQFQWAFNGTDLPGETNAVLRIPIVTTAMAGRYMVRATNSRGSILSNPARLTVEVAAPSIVVQPADRTVVTGEDTSFSVTATGLPRPVFQWLLNGQPLVNATNSTLNILHASADAAGRYSVIVSNEVATVTSAEALLTVLPPRFPIPDFDPIFVAGGNGTIIGSDIAVAPDGTFVIVGSFRETANVQDHQLVAAGGTDLFLAKADRTGKWLWTRSAGSAGSDAAGSVAVDAQGQIYVTGEFSGSITLGGTTLTSVGGTDLFVAKYDEPGNLSWTRQAGGVGNERGKGIAVTRDGDLLVAAEFHQTISVARKSVTSRGASDVCVIKYSSAGEAIWIRAGGSDGIDEVAGIAADAEGNAYFAGAFRHKVYGFRLGEFALRAAGARDFYVVKLDRAGTVSWAHRDGGFSDDFVTAIEVNALGEVYIAGAFGGYSHPSKGQQLFVSKYSADGAAIWGRQTDGVNPRLGVDAGGNVYVTGSFLGTAVFDNSTLVSRGSHDIFVLHYDHNGLMRWVKAAGGDGEDVADGIAVDGAGGLAILGRLSNGAQFDRHLVSGGASDLFVAQISPVGTFESPAITVQPLGQEVMAGATVELVVLATGNPAPTFQWQLNGSDIAGATNAVLQLRAVTPTQSGEYRVLVSNSHGSVTSDIARLSVRVAAPVITVQPASRRLSAGSDVLLSVEASATPPPAYQWHFNGHGIPGAVEPSLLLTNISLANSGAYSVLVSNEIGAAKSAEAHLDVLSPGEPVPIAASVSEQRFLANSRPVPGPRTAVDPQGNQYLVGIFTNSTTGFWPDVFIAKRDRNGQLLWTKSLGGSRSDYATGAAVDSAGFVYVTGTFVGNIRLGSTHLSSDTESSFVVKYASDGTVVWAQPLAGDGISRQTARSIAVDAQGNVYVTGSFAYRLHVGGISVTTDSSDPTMFVAKFDNSGKALWVRAAKTDFWRPGRSVGLAIHVDGTGRVWVAGEFVTFLWFETIAIQSTRGKFGGSTRDCFVARFDPEGQLLWARKAGGSEGGDRALAIVSNSAGEAYVAGQFSDSARFEDAHLISHGGIDAFIAKYDRHGNLAWVQRAGGVGSDSAVAIALDPQEQPVVAGMFNQAAQFGETQLIRPSEDVAFVAKLNKDGTFLWAKAGHGNFAKNIAPDFANQWGEFIGMGLAVDVEGTIHMSGRIDSAIEFDGLGAQPQDARSLYVVSFPARPKAPLPSISRQPQSQTVTEGAAVTLTAEVISAVATRFQWRFDGVDISDATNATLVLPSVRETDSGVYQLRVRNASGDVFSSPATVIVSPVSWVSTQAGAGPPGFKDGPANEALFNNPAAIALAPDGGMYVADMLNHTIRYIGVSGHVSTFAGTGAAGFNDGPAATAQFNGPSGITVGSGGDIFVADSGNHRIRRISTGAARNVTTVAGQSTPGFTDGPLNVAQFNSPSGIAIDANGELFVSDLENHAIRKITTSGVVTTLAGSGTAGYQDGTGRVARFTKPTGLAITGDGSLLVSDQDNHRIRKVSADGVVSTFSGSGIAGNVDGPGAVARFNLPAGIVVSAQEDVFVTERGSHSVRQIRSDGFVTTLAGNGVSGFRDGLGSQAMFSQPTGIAIDLSDRLWVADAGIHRIRQLNLGRPKLAVIQEGTDLILSWPAFAPGFVLEVTHELGANARWETVTSATTPTEQLNRVVLSVSTADRFFRLRRDTTP